MNDIYLNIYNKLIKLTRNKNLYNIKKKDTFYDRMVIFFFHLGFLLKVYKNIETKDNLQKFFDFCVRQIELSIREIGYGDATINKKMKEYINLFYSIVDKIDKWEDKDSNERYEILKLYVDDASNYEKFVEYFEKYKNKLTKITFNNITEDVLTD
tara:strand:+ start:13 stop:477 length:465 start_codon:yes stop_codon:yes gene_type:complete